MVFKDRFITIQQCGGSITEGRVMSGKTLKIQMNSKILILACSGLALAACDENGGFTMPSFGGDENAASTALDAPQVTLVERDVESPDVFSANENGLWDGRPSLGGVWVAHPDAVDPERVIIRNEANGKFVIGALFRRERENPGPALQISSDAAAELGVLAGSPTLLNVVALRREEAPVEPPALATAEFDAPAEIAATPLDPIETIEIPEATPAETVAVAEPTTDPLTGAAAIAIAAAEAALTTPEVAPQPAVAPSPSSSLEKPFIQIGIFSVEANARRTSDLLGTDGLVATVLAQESNGRPFWRVIVGPSPTSADRAAVLSKVKALGFGDAYFVTN